MTQENHVLEWLEAYLDGELKGGRLHQVEAHLQVCEDCRAELLALRQLSALLQAAAPVSSLVGAICGLSTAAPAVSILVRSTRLGKGAALRLAAGSHRVGRRLGVPASHFLDRADRLVGAECAGGFTFEQPASRDGGKRA
jgi:hypothetical protein